MSKRKGKRRNRSHSKSASKDDALRLSLNKDYRRREIDKIDFENQGIAERIIMQKSVFDLDKWKNEYKEQKRVQRTIHKKPDPGRIKEFIDMG